VPGFNTPAQSNGFALAGDFNSAEEARTFFDNLVTLDSTYLFNTLSDPVSVHQVWVQKTSSGRFVKLLVKEINSFIPENEKAYNEVVVEYFYQPDGSATFPG
jgi:hypothetical protein